MGANERSRAVRPTPPLWVGLLALAIAALLIYDAVHPESRPLLTLINRYPLVSAPAMSSVFLYGPRSLALKLVFFLVATACALHALLNPLDDSAGYLGLVAMFVAWIIIRLVWLAPTVTLREWLIVSAVCLVLVAGAVLNHLGVWR